MPVLSNSGCRGFTLAHLDPDSFGAYSCVWSEVGSGFIYLQMAVQSFLTPFL